MKPSAWGDKCASKDWARELDSFDLSFWRQESCAPCFRVGERKRASWCIWTRKIDRKEILNDCKIAIESSGIPSFEGNLTQGHKAREHNHQWWLHSFETGRFWAFHFRKRRRETIFAVWVSWFCSPWNHSKWARRVWPLCWLFLSWMHPLSNADWLWGFQRRDCQRSLCEQQKCEPLGKKSYVANCKWKG